MQAAPEELVDELLDELLALELLEELLELELLLAPGAPVQPATFSSKNNNPSNVVLIGGNPVDDVIRDLPY